MQRHLFGEPPEPKPVDPRVHRDDVPRLTRQAQQILDMLQRGPRTSIELAAVTPRYGARIHDLRKAGYQIDATRKRQGHWVYEVR